MNLPPSLSFARILLLPLAMATACASDEPRPAAEAAPDAQAAGDSAPPRDADGPRPDADAPAPGGCLPADTPCEPDAPAACGDDLCLQGPLSTCQAAVDPGAPCLDEGDCALGQWCDQGRCVDGADLGAPCADALFCRAGLGCSFPEFVCVPLPARGDACVMTRTGPTFCPAPLGCVAGLCGDMPVEGEPCTVDNRCAGGAVCAFERDGSFCRAPREAGSRCQNDAACGAERYCDLAAGRCAVRLGAGTTCRFGNECAPGLGCLPAAGGGLTCRPLPSLHQPCLDACAAGLRCLPWSDDARCVTAACVP
jgi:hypothetical protein